ncbi:LLM class flavin-dependent oxidoreductase [Cryptosporangium aurantiacum]|uniref:Flavin-dependent oxidoreductase, luciferase family (Includes alkanesulfonate monooxygenase SsuD and methylene tetrahydromethanopterin reductase) n=1 Tax=Cryptosporangium aurantiacum TaxID=134849 RepID=A0A1M7R9E2_9ACTN|nr:LLM class flavin-dependent oxidoreductase [Cryptosporangium aurantiacum]SHN42772.1 Flavin-dependent oxidoreductase, luciferase family (includes alkanesulfonate monooxygenase SsuD and methylene tetrahydromethanopterin reductase) [Cryptosporangium aurantiacum]
MTSLGVVFRPQVPPEQLRAVARAADEAGLEELWLWEDCFWQSGIAAAAAALAVTERLRVGIGLLPVPFRNVALASMEIATLERMFPGRFLPGVGHGVQEWMGQVGARESSPMTLLREHVDAMRTLLRGEEVSTSGRYVTLDKVKLDWPPAQPPQILVGAVGPKTLRLAGEAADGTILDGQNSPERVRWAVGEIEAGRAAAGRTDPHRVVVFTSATTGPDAAERLRREHQAWGHDVTSDLGVAGDAEAFAKGTARYVDAGADALVFTPTADEADLEGYVRFVAQEVKPLVG